MKFLKGIFMSMFTASTVFGSHTEPKPQVVIIGAGIAGLTAAYRLHQKGISVAVYEAKNRVGGRIFSAKIDSEVIELGGQNLSDGGEAENLSRLIDEFKLELQHYPSYLTYEFFDGDKFISEEGANKRAFNPSTLREEVENAALGAKNMREVLDKLLHKEDILYKVSSVRLAAWEGGSVDRLSPLCSETLYHMLMGGLCHAHPSMGEVETFIDIVSVKGGNSLIAKNIAEVLGERIHLNHPLVSVSKTSDESYELTFKNGKKVTAPILVLAMPCSVYEDIEFKDETIPHERLSAIQKVEYGTNAKIIVPFSGTPSKAITYINDHMGGFFADPSALTLYFTGNSSRFSKKTINDSYQQERVILEKSLEGTCFSEEAPIYAKDELLATYQGPVGYSWPSDPYAKGTYSYMASGKEMLLTAKQSAGNEEVLTLFAPINQKLFFAGEHASLLMEVAGTMEAACESGERIARMIASEIH